MKTCRPVADIPRRIGALPRPSPRPTIWRLSPALNRRIPMSHHTADKLNPFPAENTVEAHRNRARPHLPIIVKKIPMFRHIAVRMSPENVEDTANVHRNRLQFHPPIHIPIQRGGAIGIANCGKMNQRMFFCFRATKYFLVPRSSD